MYNPKEGPRACDPKGVGGFWSTAVLHVHSGVHLDHPATRTPGTSREILDRIVLEICPSSPRIAPSPWDA